MDVYSRVVESKMNTNVNICAAFSMILILLLTPLLTGAKALEYFSITSQPFGKPYDQWVEEWMKWWFTTDKDVLNTKLKNSDCIAKLDGPVVFFMSPTWSGPDKRVMTCEISSQQGILFTFLSGECDTELPEMKNASYDKLLRCAEEDNEADYISMTGHIDGIPIERKDIQSVSTNKSNFENFKLEFRPNNLYDAVPGTYDAAATGYFVFLEPLSVGNHTINFKTLVLGAPWQFNSDITYNLKVVE
jgi:hypothetical protein